MKHFPTDRPAFILNARDAFIIYFDAAVRDEKILCDEGKAVEVSISEGAILIGNMAFYWLKRGKSSSPEAELKTAVMAAKLAQGAILGKSVKSVTIYGDNLQAIGALKTREPHLNPFALDRETITKQTPGLSWEHVESPNNPADEIIRKVRAARDAGLPVPRIVSIYREGELSEVTVIESSSIP